MQSPPDLLVAFEAGRARWPAIGMPFERFVTKMQELDVDGEDLVRHNTDLFLAVGCASGEPSALRYFESDFLSQVDRYVARFDLPAHRVDELRQRLRMKLLVGSSPGIASYRGRAPLESWLRVTAVRLAIDAAVIATHTDVDVDLLEMVAVGQNPEIETAKRLYGERFRSALETSFRCLPARDKTLLRLHVVDGLNVDSIGTIYGVHRATAARWLVAVRARVFDKLKEEFALRWKASSSEVRSLANLLRDQIYLSAKRILVEPDRP